MTPLQKIQVKANEVRNLTLAVQKTELRAIKANEAHNLASDRLFKAELELGSLVSELVGVRR